jgi:hypothetical protein
VKQQLAGLLSDLSVGAQNFSQKIDSGSLPYPTAFDAHKQTLYDFAGFTNECSDWYGSNIIAAEVEPPLKSLEDAAFHFQGAEQNFQSFRQSLDPELLYSAARSIESGMTILYRLPGKPKTPPRWPGTTKLG